MYITMDIRFYLQEPQELVVCEIYASLSKLKYRTNSNIDLL